jgi:transposase
MKPCPLELRERIVGAVDQQTHTIAELAELFQVSERYIYKLLKLRRDTGELAPLPHSGGIDPLFDDAKLLQLAQCVAASPDATLKELQTLVRRQCRLKVCLTTIWSALRKLDLTVKKNTSRRRSRRPAARCLPSLTTHAPGTPPLVP